jgi:membrane protein DedA with SNARE-associated domain
VFCIVAGFIGLTMPRFIDIINHISPLKWGSWVVINAVFKGETFTCTEKVNGVCPISKGEQVIDLYGMSEADSPGGLGFHLWVIIVVTLGYVLIAYGTLRVRMHLHTG